MAATPYELARVAAIAADDKKATDIVLLDLENDSDVCEYFLIFSAPNTRLLDAIIDEIREKMKKTLNIGPLSQEGRARLRIWFPLSRERDVHPLHRSK